MVQEMGLIVKKSGLVLLFSILWNSVFAQNEINYSAENIPIVEEQVLNDIYLNAPNSYIYDIDLAAQNNFSGLKIPVKKAFEIWADEDWYLNEQLNPNGILSAYVYWEDVNGLISDVGIESGSSAEDSKIAISVNPKKGKGNAVISLHLGSAGNSEDQIIWSWHIWVTDDPTEGVAYGQGIETDIDGNLFVPQYMDRNLGAISSHILGHNWHKTSGLMYEWGRKDPIPPFSTKDLSFHEISGLVGYMRNREGIHHGNVLPEVMRPFEDISSNLKYSIQNPIHYLLNSDGGTWFSAQQYRIPGDNNVNVAWNLWSDNRRGENSNASSSNDQIRNDSRSYELKSPYDPCPNGWRIPSHLGRVTVNNNHSPWGRKNSGVNDDVNPTNNTFYPDQPNPVVLDAKIYPGLGFDFSEAHSSNGDSRNIGMFPTSGYYVPYPASSGQNPTVVFQDRSSQSLNWSATYALGGARHLKLITDPMRLEVSELGLHQILVNQTIQSYAGLPVRCMKDPNLDLMGDFETEYISSTKTYFTQGLYNPNSYLIYDETELLIPVNKAFSAYENLFPEQDNLPDNDLKANVYWTDNRNLIQSVQFIENAGDARESLIKLTLNQHQKGNAIISLHNESIQNPVYWSWHIWVPSDEIQEITYVNQPVLEAEFNLINSTVTGNPPLTTKFMDRNLGALDDLPLEFIDYPNQPELVDEVKNSGGFHYQWGRKDPIPSFKKVGGETYEIYRGISVDANGAVTYQPLNSMNFQNEFTENYTDYKIRAGVNPTDSKYLEIDKILHYSVQNPLTYLHKNTISNSDWVSGELGLADDRWGHATQKSIYDPCPADWRVPDVFKVHEDGLGTSPWFNGKKTGAPQGSQRNLSTHYGGEFTSLDNQPVGWFFNDSDYQIGHFPTTGIIGKFSPSAIGGTDIGNAISGVWTAALTQQMKGFALGMTMGKISGSDQTMIATGNLSPSYGLNVRCAADERRYTGDLGEDYFEMDVRDFSNSQNLKDIRIYPNPVIDFLYISGNQNWSVEIYDLQGRIVRKDKFQQGKINLTDLNKGIYIGLITNTDTSETVTAKIVKN